MPSVNHRLSPLLLPLLWSACAGSPDAQTRATPNLDDPTQQRKAPSPDPGAALNAARHNLSTARAVAARPQVKARLRAQLERAREEATRLSGGWRGALPAQPDYRTILNPKRRHKGSLSVGTVGSGSLERSQKLSLSGKYHRVVDRARSRKTNFATADLIALLDEAAREVAREHPGSVLALGNMSYQGGGDIPWSVSHNSGRDADVVFYSRRVRDGKVVVTPDLVAFNDRGLSIGVRPKLKFDVARNWALVRALMTSERAQVQWLFISEGLKALLLDHARATGEDPALVEQASKVLHQPSQSGPHRDHLHLRITCPGDDRLDGCRESGPRWPWIDWHDRALLAWTMALRGAFDDPDLRWGERALEELERIRPPQGAAILLAYGARSRHAELREGAIKLAARWYFRRSPVVLWLTHALLEAGRGPHRYLYRILRHARSRHSLAFLQRRIRDSSLPLEERKEAARALEHQLTPKLVPFLLEALAGQPAELRPQLAEVLRRITSHSQGLDWQKAAEDRRKQALVAWRAWWSAQPQQGRDWESLLTARLQREGLTQEQLADWVLVDPLLKVLARPDLEGYMVYNVNRYLRERTHHWSPLEEDSAAKLHKRWTKWWSRYKKRVLP